MSKTVINITELPEITDILSTDKFYVFQQTDSGRYAPKIVEFSALSLFFHGKEIANRLNEKMQDLIRLSGEFMTWLDNNYATQSYISANYSTITYFNEVLDEVMTNASFDSYVNDFATHEYGNAKLAEAEAEYESLKLSNTVEYSDKLINAIPFRPTDDGTNIEAMQDYLSGMLDPMTTTANDAISYIYSELSG